MSVVVKIQEPGEKSDDQKKEQKDSDEGKDPKDSKDSKEPKSPRESKQSISKSVRDGRDQKDQKDQGKKELEFDKRDSDSTKETDTRNRNTASHDHTHERVDSLEKFKKYDSMDLIRYNKSQEERTSLQGKKELLKNYRVTMETLKIDAKNKVVKKSTLKNIFNMVIAVLFASTSLMSSLQFTDDNQAFKVITTILCVGNMIISGVYNTLKLEKDIIRHDKISRGCESLIIEMDRSIYTTKHIDDTEIDTLINKIKMIIDQTAIEIELQQHSSPPTQITSEHLRTRTGAPSTLKLTRV